jgi:outer membrane receptor protein involved in Fe transport
MLLHKISLLVLLASFAAAPAGAQVEGDPPAPPKDREVLLSSDPDDIDIVVSDPAPEPSGDIDEMVVLATGRDDFLKDMTVSVTSFSAAEIKSLRIQNIADLAEFTPNLEINTRSAASNPTLFIRGIGLKDYNANAAGAVAVYNDGVNINSPAIQLGQLFDVEEIQVLRGPQGAANGRNATAGAIMLNSVLPDGGTDRSLDVSYGNYNSVNLEGALSFPLVEDLLSTRMAFTANFRDGYVKNHCADWDPESVGLPLINEQTVRDAWEFNGRPDHAGNAPTGAFPDHIRNGAHRNQARQGLPHNHLRPNNVSNINRFPTAGSTEHPGQRDVQNRRMLVDGICVQNQPGYLEFDTMGNEEWIALTGTTILTPEDFQGLKHHTNNVDNWAARTIFRYQPDVDDGMDWILNLHGGQNRGDSAKLQSIATEFNFKDGDPFFSESTSGAPERNSILEGIKNGKEFEGIRIVDNLAPQSPQGQVGAVETPGGRAGDDIDAGFYDSDGIEKLDSWGAGLRGLWDPGSVKVRSITGYEQYKRTIDDEGDASSGRLARAFYDDKAYQISQELRVSGEGELYRWSVGGFMLYEDLKAGNLFPGLASRRIEQDFKQQLTSGATYASGRYWLIDEVYLDAGIRYNREHKKFTLESDIRSNSGVNEQIPEDTVSKTWTGVTGEATLAWEPGSDWMYDARLDFLNLYLKYGRGMKGGHFNAGLTIQPNAKQTQTIGLVDPEFLHSVEAGFKSRWFQNRMSINFAIFRYWYEDLQVFDYSNEVGELPIQKLLNSDADVLGAEIEIQVRPLPGFLVQFGGGWLDSEFKDFIVNKATVSPRSQGDLDEFDYSGNPLISAPKYSASWLTEYQIPLLGYGTLVPQYNGSWRSKVFLDPQGLDLISQDAYWQHNARLAYRTPGGQFEIAAWVENIKETRYKIDVFDVSLGENRVLEVWNEPRMYGGTFSAYF